MKAPKQIELSHEQIQALLERLQSRTLIEVDYAHIEAIVETFVYPAQAMDDKNTSMKRLLKLIFGSRTEKSKNVLKRLEHDEADNGSPGMLPKASRKLRTTRQWVMGETAQGLIVRHGES